MPSDGFAQAAFGDGSLYNGANPLSFARGRAGVPVGDRRSDAPVNKNFGSYHNGVVNFLMADTSYRAMAIDTSGAVLGQLARRGE